MLAWENEFNLGRSRPTPGAPQSTAEFDGPVVAAAGSPDGSHVAAALLVGDAAAAVVVLDRRTGAELGRVVEGTDVPANAPGGGRCGDGTVAAGGLARQRAARGARVGRSHGPVRPDPARHRRGALAGPPGPVLVGDQGRRSGPVAVTGAVQPGVVVDLGTGQARRIKGAGDVLAVSRDGAVAAVTSWSGHVAPRPAGGPDHGRDEHLDGDRSAHAAAGLPRRGRLLHGRDGARPRRRRDCAAARSAHRRAAARAGRAQRRRHGGGVHRRRRRPALVGRTRRRRLPVGLVRPARHRPAAGVDAAAARIVAASRDGRTGVVLDWHDDAFNEARLVDPATGLPLSPDPLPMPEDCACQPFPVAITPDGRTALAGLDVMSDPDDWSAPHTGRLLLWDVASRQIRADLELPWAPVGLGVVGDGTRALVNGTDGWAVVDITRSRVLTTVADGPRVAQLEVPDSVAVSPDGRRAAVGREHDVVLVDGRTGDELHRHRLPDGDGMLTGTWVDRRTLVVGGWAECCMFSTAGTSGCWRRRGWWRPAG